MTTTRPAGECVVDFGRRHSLADAIELMTRATEVTDSTALSWMLGKVMPTGEKLVKLLVLLDMAGYELEEYASLNEVVRTFAGILGLGLISVEEAQQRLGYASKNGVLDLVLRGTGALPDKAHELRRINSEYAVAMARTRFEWHDLISVSEYGEVVVGPEVSPAAITNDRWVIEGALKFAHELECLVARVEDLARTDWQSVVQLVKAWLAQNPEALQFLEAIDRVTGIS